MKLSAIKRCCLEKERFDIRNAENGEQWIGDGCSFWPVEGVKIEEAGVAELFDLTPKKAAECWIGETDVDDWRFARVVRPEAETALKDLGAYWYGETTYRALKALNDDFGLLFIPESALDPARGKDDFAYFARFHDAGSVLVAVYRGLLCSALVSPLVPDMALKIVEKAARITATPILALEVGNASENV